MAGLPDAGLPEDEQAYLIALIRPPHPAAGAHPGQSMTDTTVDAPAEDAAPQTLNPTQTLLIATACGALAANLYYAQPLVDMIGPSVGLGKAAEGLVVTATQIGYAVGLVFLVPLGDFFESRRLILISMLTNVLAILGVVLTRGASGFFIAMFSSARRRRQPRCWCRSPPR